MKRLMKYFACLVAVLLACMTFTACGGDDDEDGGGSSQSSIVGTWEVYYESNSTPAGYSYVFYAGGKGKMVDYYYGDEVDDEVFTWSYNESSRVITIKFTFDGDMYIEYIKVISMDSDMITGIQYDNGSYDLTTGPRVQLYKVK